MDVRDDDGIVEGAFGGHLVAHLVLGPDFGHLFVHDFNFCRILTMD